MYVRIYIYVHLYMCSPERRIIAAALPLFSKAIAIVATKEPRSVNVYIYISIYYKLFFFFFAFIVTCAFFPDFSPRQTRIRIRSTVCVYYIMSAEGLYTYAGRRKKVYGQLLWPRGRLNLRTSFARRRTLVCVR